MFITSLKVLFCTSLSSPQCQSIPQGWPTLTNSVKSLQAFSIQLVIHLQYVIGFLIYTYHCICKYQIKLYCFEIPPVHLTLCLRALSILVLPEPWRSVNGSMVSILWMYLNVYLAISLSSDIQVVSHLFLLQSQLQGTSLYVHLWDRSQCFCRRVI